MNKKNDMIAALSRRRPLNAVPVWELEFQAWDAASERHVVLGHEFEALDADGQEAALHDNAEIFLSVSEEMNFAAVSTPNVYWNEAPGKLAYYCLPDGARFRQMDILKRDCPDNLMLVANASGVISADYSEDFCEQLFEDPEAIDRLVREKLESGIRMAGQMRDHGAGAVFSASDIADNSGPFFNPEQMKRWILPSLYSWAEAVHEMGMFAILHSDGNLMPYLGAIAGTGIDALQAIDSIAGMDMARCREIAGDRLCLCGNVDCGLLLTSTPEAVFSATGDLLESVKDSGAFVLGASNAVQPDVPMENYRAMIAAWKKHGRYTQPG